jgi:hypothetical protein
MFKQFRKAKKYILDCDLCDKNKISYQKPIGKMQSHQDKPNQPWEHVTADFLEMPPTKHPFPPGLLDELLVVVDTFSKQIVLIQIEITSVAQRHQEFNH